MQTGFRSGNHFLSRLKFNSNLMGKFTLRPLNISDRYWVAQRIVESWGAEIIVDHETIYHPAELPGFVALAGKKIVGLLTYHLEGSACEIVTLDSWDQGQGIGIELIEAVKQTARQEGSQRLWLITTNDNTNALHFYQKRGFVIVRIRINAMEKARLIKPEIPLTGKEGIPLRDEIELEMLL
jgi:ribosomal protein S18 acetylase RimI-like enzyme